MPYRNNRIELTPEFHNLDIDSLSIQEAPKYLLRCMREIPKETDGTFLYCDLVQYMRSHTHDYDLYQGNGITSLDNINRYWQYALSPTHGARIPNFQDYFVLLN